MLKDVPQIVPETGVSGDYLNEYNSKVLVFRLLKNDGLVAGFPREFERSPIKKYTDKYPISKYNYRITYRIEKLDELAEEANKLLSKNFKTETFGEILKEAWLLVTDELPRFKL